MSDWMKCGVCDTMARGNVDMMSHYRVKHPELVMSFPKNSEDRVNHPKHYTSDPSGVECITITRHRNFNVGNAIKYLWRAGLKDADAHVEDLQKAVFYINDEIERLRGAHREELHRQSQT